jgi:hypothetical protein
MPANPEFQELIIKHTALGLLTEVPEMQIYSLRHMKRRRISKELYWCSCYSYCFIRDACRKISDWRTHPLYRCFLSLS